MAPDKPPSFIILVFAGRVRDGIGGLKGHVALDNFEFDPSVYFNFVLIFNLKSQQTFIDLVDPFDQTFIYG